MVGPVHRSGWSFGGGWGCEARSVIPSTTVLTAQRRKVRVRTGEPFSFPSPVGGAFHFDPHYGPTAASGRHQAQARARPWAWGHVNGVEGVAVDTGGCVQAEGSSEVHTSSRGPSKAPRTTGGVTLAWERGMGQGGTHGDQDADRGGGKGGQQPKEHQAAIRADVVD